ncbi:hypothetical protein MUNTM_04000 [Mycobacterium sp. MUNTM1]
MAIANQHDASPVRTRVEVLGNIGPNWFASVMGTGIDWLRHPAVARSHARNPQMANFCGATPHR